MHLCFYRPGYGGLVVFFEEGVGHESVFILRVEEKSIHIEETCADWGEAWDGKLMEDNKMAGECGREFEDQHTQFGMP